MLEQLEHADMRGNSHTRPRARTREPDLTAGIDFGTDDKMVRRSLRWMCGLCMTSGQSAPKLSNTRYDVD